MDNQKFEKEISKELTEEVKVAKEMSWLLPASILIAAILIAGSVIYSTGVKNSQPQQQGQNNQPQAVEIAVGADDPVLGDPKAPVEFIEFADFQCPFCAKFYKESGMAIRDSYVKAGKVKMVYKGIAILGDESVNATLAVYCAKDQNKFWEFHDALYDIEYAELEKVLAGQMESNEHNGNLNRTLFEKLAADFGMNTSEFLSCYDSKKYEGVLQSNLQQASEAMNGRISTPTLFVNGKMVQGAQPFNVFVGMIDALIK